jgi:hypothetical protein
MKHVMYAEKSLLMDDASAEALIDYAAALADSGGADTVRLRAVGEDGNEVEAAFLLNSATVLIIESASAVLDIVPNDDAVAFMRRRTDQLRNPRPSPTHTLADAHEFDFDEIS